MDCPNILKKLDNMSTDLKIGYIGWGICAVFCVSFFIYFCFLSKIRERPKKNKGESIEEGKIFGVENEILGVENETLEAENERLKKENVLILEEKRNIQEELDKRKSQFSLDWQKTVLYPDWKKEFFQAENVSLDPVTSHPNLILSEDKRCVRWGQQPQDVPEDPQRFYSLPCVLGKQIFTSGRSYWEVEVGDNGSWDLGVCMSNVMRKGRVVLKPDDGFWAIRYFNNEYWALTSPETLLKLRSHTTKVCIFLDYEDGHISFYNMTDNSHIHTFSQCSFYGSLRPLFRLWSGDSETLTICTV